jgi:hypothetical protein
MLFSPEENANIGVSPEDRATTSWWPLARHPAAEIKRVIRSVSPDEAIASVARLWVADAQLAGRRAGDEPHRRSTQRSWRSDMTTMKRLLGVGSATLLAFSAALAGLSMSTGRAHADPVWHQVVYVVTSTSPVNVDIFYSHNNYAFTPQVHADVGPGTPWVQPVNLLNPDQWAMVTATSGRGPATPAGIQCDLSVDGKVVVSKVGPKGALCSLRTW